MRTSVMLILLVWTKSLLLWIPVAQSAERELTIGELCSSCVGEASKVSGIELSGRLVSSTGEVRLQNLAIWSIETEGEETFERGCHYRIWHGNRAYILSSSTWPVGEDQDDPFTQMEIASLQLARENVSKILSAVSCIKPGAFVAHLWRDESRVYWWVPFAGESNAQVVESGPSEYHMEIEEPSLEATLFQLRMPSLALRFGLRPPLLQNTRPLRPDEPRSDSSAVYYPIATIDGRSGRVSAGEVVVSTVPAGASFPAVSGSSVPPSDCDTRNYAVTGAILLALVNAVFIVVYTRRKARKHSSRYTGRLIILSAVESALIILSIFLLCSSPGARL